MHAASRERLIGLFDITTPNAWFTRKAGTLQNALFPPNIFF